MHNKIILSESEIKKIIKQSVIKILSENMQQTPQPQQQQGVNGANIIQGVEKQINYYKQKCDPQTIPNCPQEYVQFYNNCLRKASSIIELAKQAYTNPNINSDAILNFGKQKEEFYGELAQLYVQYCKIKKGQELTQQNQGQQSPFHQHFQQQQQQFQQQQQYLNNDSETLQKIQSGQLSWEDAKFANPQFEQMRQNYLAQTQQMGQMGGQQTQCPNCGNPLNPNAKFCTKCGTPLKCPNCGNPLRPNVKFCTKCGTPINGASQQPTNQQR
jgi:predicted RNA-binding Zn-ribbon protein involved in translation (DUF1610 family)